MNVDELNNRELEELLERFQDQLRGEGEESEEVIDNLTYDDVRAHYDNYDFVKEDFFCNLEDTFDEDHLSSLMYGVDNNQ